MLHNPLRPSARWVFARPQRILAFGFGSGLIYPAPGTWGTLLGWLLWVYLFAGLNPYWALLILPLAFVLGCLVAQRCGQELGIPDHGGINWDEIVAIWLVLWLVPGDFWYQLMAVALFRIFDILKPVPINVFDKHFKNGFGVMIDDVIAAIYAVLAVQAIIRLLDFI